MNASEFQALKQAIIDDVRVMMQTTGQVTQYIGARYVPLISDPIEWSDQKEYEPLTIVTYQGNSYTSRQFVPKGTPITNEQFWASTGNFNAQIEQYRQEVAKFDSRITAAQNAADSKAPINHATDSAEYGIGNALNYGHVKLADDDTPMTSGANDGVAATPKMVDSQLENHKSPMTISPIVIGYSFIDKLNDDKSKFHTGAISIDGDKQTIIASSEKTNAGIAFNVDILGDIDYYTNAKTVDLGHANSICFDGTYYYVCPIWDYTADKANANYIYKYNKDFSNRVKLTCPETMMGCSVDKTNNSIYFYAYSHTIYKLNSQNFDNIAVYDNKLVNPNQDFAVYDGVFYLTSTKGFIVTGDVNTGKTTQIFNVSNIDVDTMYNLGELCGMDFTADGDDTVAVSPQAVYAYAQPKA